MFFGGVFGRFFCSFLVFFGAVLAVVFVSFWGYFRAVFVRLAVFCCLGCVLYWVVSKLVCLVSTIFRLVVQY